MGNVPCALRSGPRFPFACRVPQLSPIGLSVAVTVHLTQLLSPLVSSFGEILPKGVLRAAAGISYVTDARPRLVTETRMWDAVAVWNRVLVIFVRRREGKEEEKDKRHTRVHDYVDCEQQNVINV